MNTAVFNKLFVNKAGLYILLVFALAFNLSSHTFAYWPGDSWWLRSAYWVLYIVLSLSCIFGLYYALARMLEKHSPHIVFLLAIILSWIPFGLAITMLDIATARPEISYVIGDLQNTGFLPTLLPIMVMVILPKHLVFGGLMYLLNFYVHIGTGKINKPPLPADNLPEYPELAHVTFMNKLSDSMATKPLLLQAQEHYLRVTTEFGSELILYKFGQAVREIPESFGVQVHRSFWIAKQNITGWCATEGGIKVSVHHGAPVPVSRRFEQMVKQQFPEIPA
ncbi:MAG: hypothetical protein ACJA0C_000133 [Candidatus Endobugula sp.]|jgi:hypothetical protein